MTNLEIIRDCARAFNVPSHLIFAPTRRHRVVRAKYTAIREIHAIRPWLTLGEIGDVFGMDQSSIGYALGRQKRKPTI